MLLFLFPESHGICVAVPLDRASPREFSFDEVKTESRPGVRHEPQVLSYPTYLKLASKLVVRPGRIESNYV